MWQYPHPPPSLVDLQGQAGAGTAGVILSDEEFDHLASSPAAFDLCAATSTATGTTGTGTQLGPAAVAALRYRQPVPHTPWLVTGPIHHDYYTDFTLASATGFVEGDGPGSLGASPTLTQDRKRNASLAGFDSSPASASFDSPDHNGDDHGRDRDARRRPVKRACNECRQQKLRCDVVQEPFQICTRCKRLSLECKIEDNFKRVGKRSRNAEMEREIIELRKQVAQQHPAPAVHNGALPDGTANETRKAHAHTHAHAGIGTFTPDAAAAGLLDLRGGSFDKDAGKPVFKRLDDVALSLDRVQDLFQRFFTFHHPFLPFLNPERTPEEFYHRSPLLFWTIALVGARHYTPDPDLFTALSGPVTRLLWSTIADVPQNYHVVKALILLCAWPPPTSSTSTDSTFMLCGLMMQVALQIGLHRPTHAQDFTKFRVELREVELQDRVVVWTVCNIVAQRICTAYGQPPLSIYDWTLGPKPIETNPNYQLPAPIFNRLLIEKFVDRVSRTLYMNPHDPVGLASDAERPTYVSFLTHDLDELEDKLRKDTSPITQIYLKAAALHMRLNAFFSPPSLPSYRTDMLKLYYATTDFLETCLSLESTISVSLPSSYTQGLSLNHATNYLFHMMLAGGFSLLKLMRNFLGEHNMDTKGASELLSRTVWALRSMSVVENDLAERLAEVLAQVWKSGRLTAEPGRSAVGDGDVDDSLQLKVKCRMSMSLVFDSVWRWRRNFQFRGGKPSDGKSTDSHLALHAHGDAVRQRDPKLAPPDGISIPHATTMGGPDGHNAHTTLSGAADPMLSSTAAIVPGMAGMATGMLDDFGVDYGQAHYDVFDPLNWMLDGLVDFPYNFSTVQGTNDLAATEYMT